MDRFAAAAAIILGDEGARSNDPRDPGGLTVYGHDNASWPSWGLVNIVQTRHYIVVSPEPSA